jgi:hypothetical protein
METVLYLELDDHWLCVMSLFMSEHSFDYPSTLYTNKRVEETVLSKNGNHSCFAHGGMLWDGSK